MRKSGPRIFEWLVGFIACAGCGVVELSAQTYPVKPIRMLVGFPPGGSSDASARIVAQKLSESLGQQVVVENRPGAGGSMAIQRVATSPADGYTLLMMGSSSTAHPALFSKLPYDLERDLAPISLVAVTPYVLAVHASVPARNVKELIALARSQPGKLNYASGGIGTPGHLAAELLNMMAKINLIHVPYKGGADAAIALASGQVDMSFPSVAAALPLLEAAKIRALAMSTAKRSSLMPSISTMEESGLTGYDISGWYGVVARAGVAKDVIALLNTVIGKIVHTSDTKEAFNRQGFEPLSNTPQQFAMLLRTETARNAKLIRMIRAKTE